MNQPFVKKRRDFIPVNEHRDNSILRELFRRESRTFLQYVREAFPWTRTGGEDAVGRIHRLAEAEQQTAARIAQLLQKRHEPLPYLGQFPMDYTTQNFVALDHLLPLLREEQERDVAALDRDVAALTNPEARAVVQQLLDVKRAHLSQLQK